MNGPELKQRVTDLLAEEQASPETWWYLSFALPKSEGGFLGGVFVRARGMTDALTRATADGLNPGGQVAGLAIPPGGREPAPEMVGRLLTREEVEAS